MADSSSSSSSKRQKQHDDDDDDVEEQQPLIPGLPDHIAELCLSSINHSLLFSISHSCRRLIYSPSFPPFFSLYAILSHSSATIHFHTFDPISATWLPLPPHPPLHHLLLRRHPSFLSRSLSVQSVSSSNRLVLLAATTHNLSPALPQPLIFHPLTKTWSFGPTLSTPRRWCALGSLGPTVYVASGIGSHFSIHVARSLQKWNLQNPNAVWEKKTELKDGRFSREAIDAVGWKQKLCMVNVKGDAAKEGVVYDVAEDAWKEMPEGMLYGWRGPVAAMEEEVMYVVDEAKGVLRRYVEEQDAWEDILENKRLKGAEQIVAQRGKLCVVSPSSGISVVDVAAVPPRIVPILLPEEFEPVAVHILPRMPADQ
ncbi:hypothetical protein JHK82_025812 [Glycine max]|uniref:F-box/kelch-repeat protein SKIP25 n=1 Tax=Glycine soja TaxID=3848 RepID=A0A445J4A5_GLYSO|nr:F-box/kelch-repeat protein SKIP25 [Glycine max]XP_028179635.1 F-box/kelch-repeat protein SKIP25-like [Glycine soja]KAG4388687.1 hypothetical protein GLYMA_09G215301v4 [Glycine max]KAG5007887.1 hypothetical protein JHK85_026429 [Glycine max]KAG5134624.1 hypothetical protein JHK82_025812 [Glycine max]RZB93210.1 F-box/kelch-repeat protein SKIP25 [Glycine soja]